MRVHEELAWSMLTEVEKNSLYLTLTNGLSSWEAGEVLKISHYKYLELKERSEKFFKMFCEFYECGIEGLFSPKTVADERFRDYIDASLCKRLPRAEAVIFAGDSALRVPDISQRHILKNMDLLMKSENDWDIRVYKLIMEFDRWNNWRILPRAIQQPSAYKRRNNKRDKVYLRYINKIPQYKIEAIMDIYWYVPRKKNRQMYYITLISRELFEDGYKVIPIKTEESTLKKISKLCIYAFKDEQQADVFGYMVTKYFDSEMGSVQGLKFWPEYRDLLGRTVNYNMVNNINFYVDRLDMAYQDFTHKPNKSTTKHGATRASEDIF